MTGTPHLRPGLFLVAVVLTLVVGCGNDGGPSPQESAQKGREIFDGTGNCTLCHTVDGGGADGGGVDRRGPDLSKIGGLAAGRAELFGLSGAHAGSRYLTRSIIRPSDDVVEGHNPMPESWLPSGLSDDDIRDLVVYLQTLGGEPDPTTIAVPRAWTAAKRQDYGRELELFAFGDPQKGQALFADPKGTAGCIKCHAIDGVGEDVCPDLSSVRRVQRPGYLLQSILDSSAFIVHGYQQLMIWDDAGLLHMGLPTAEDEDTITLVIDDDGNTDVVKRESIDEQRPSDVSRMPGNFGELLTAEQVMDLVAYLLRHDELAASDGSGVTAAVGPGAVETDPAAGPSFHVFDAVAKDRELYRMALEHGDPVGGRRLYAHYCVMCHGETGTGDGWNAVNLETKPANHTDDRRLSKTEDRLLHGVVARGGMNTGRSFLMPPWGGTFTDRELWDLVAYIRTLHADVK